MSLTAFLFVALTLLAVVVGSLLTKQSGSLLIVVIVWLIGMVIICQSFSWSLAEMPDLGGKLREVQASGRTEGDRLRAADARHRAFKVECRVHPTLAMCNARLPLPVREADISRRCASNPSAGYCP
jgi:hypothetical protein